MMTTKPMQRGRDDVVPDYPSMAPFFSACFPSCLWIPGALHILHSATKDLTHALDHFADPFLTHLRSVVEFLDKSYMRERFVTVCLRWREAVRIHV